MKLHKSIITFLAAFMIVYVCPVAVATAQELSARYATPGDVGLLHYDAPASAENCIQWDDGIYNDAIGLTSGGTMSVASRWEPSDLPAGKTITSISVGVYTAPSGDAFVQIWQGTNLSSMELQYSQAFTPVGDQMNEVILDTPYAIDYSKDLMFGWTATHSSGQYPHSIDAGAHPDMKGDMIFSEAIGMVSWGNLSNYGLSGDWLLEACFGDAVQYVLDTGDPNERACNPRSYTDLGTGIVRDNTTGLEWMQATALDTYAWQDALDYVDELNDNNTLGYSDWRLPGIEELLSLVDAGLYNSAIDPLFSDTQPSAYWSSTSYADDAGRAWYVNFFSGTAYSFGTKSSMRYVRAVRGAQYGPFGNFVDNSDGTVTDTVTDLMWQQCGYGQAWDGDNCTGSAGRRTWQQAFEYVQDLNDNNTLGYNDWRLPTRNELQTLNDYTLFDPTTVFPGTVPSQYWSSTNYVPNDTNAWVVYFYNGFVDYYLKSNIFYVRAVRGGPCRSQGDWCLDQSDCDDDLFCTGTETCVDSVCEEGADPCEGDNATPFCDEENDVCVECLADGDCDDDSLFCTGDPVCDEGFCDVTGNPCGEGAPVCDEDNDTCVECLSDGDCPDDGLYCTGAPTCTDGMCGFAEDSCEGDTPVCDEDSDTCVECIVDGDCGETEVCRANVCMPRCELIVKHKRIRADKLTKPRRFIVTVTSLDEIFDIYGLIDPGVFTWDKVKFNRKKNRLKIHATVPAGLAPGAYPIRVGDCFGEVVITGSDR